MVDPELDAMSKCTEALKDLEDDVKIRILEYLVKRFRLAQVQQQSFQQKTDEQPQLPATPLLGTEIDSSSARATFSKTHPAIKDVVAKDLPKSEPEWVLVYCYYASEFGEKEFKRDEIINQYQQSKRWSEQKIRNLSLNLTSIIKKDWIKSINDTEFIILDDGKKYADEILSGNSTTKPRKATHTKKEKKETIATDES